MSFLLSDKKGTPVVSSILGVGNFSWGRKSIQGWNCKILVKKSIYVCTVFTNIVTV
jgi:hypothetical protein